LRRRPPKAENPVEEVVEVKDPVEEVVEVKGPVEEVVEVKEPVEAIVEQLRSEGIEVTIKWEHLPFAAVEAWVARHKSGELIASLDIVELVNKVRQVFPAEKVQVTPDSAQTAAEEVEVEDPPYESGSFSEEFAPREPSPDDLDFLE